MRSPLRGKNLECLTEEIVELPVEFVLKVEKTPIDFSMASANVPNSSGKNMEQTFSAPLSTAWGVAERYQKVTPKTANFLVTKTDY
jgi:hypothetical protein